MNISPGSRSRLAYMAKSGDEEESSEVDDEEEVFEVLNSIAS